MIGFLRSPYAILCVLVLALAAQVPHAASVFSALELLSDNSTWHNYGFAIALELAVLVFVVHGCTNESYAFAGVSVAMNLCYYGLHGMDLISLRAIPALLVSVALPFAIARYSHLAAQSFGVNAQPIAFEWKTVTQWLHTKFKKGATLPIIEVAPAQSIIPVCIDGVQVSDDCAIDKKTRAVQMHTEGLGKNAIAHALDVHRNTVGKWLKEMRLSESGVNQ